MIPGTRLFELEKKSLASGGNYQINLQTLPQDGRVRGFLKRITLVVTQPAAGMQAFAGEALARVLDAVTIGSRFRASGVLLDRIAWVMHGRDLNAPADIPATASTTFTRNLDVYLPLADPTAHDPSDTSPAALMFKDDTLLVNAPAFSAIFPGATAVTVDVRTFAVLDPFDGVSVATPSRINFMEVQGGTTLLPAGTYSHVVLYREDGTAITDAQLSAIRLVVDGKTVADRLTVGDFATLYNLQRASGGAKAVASATAPEAGEALDSGSSVQFVPLYVPNLRYKLTKLLTATSQVSVELTGNTAGLRIGYRMLEEQGPDEVLRAARKLGVEQLTSMKSKTLSKTEAVGRVARILPKKLG